MKFTILAFNWDEDTETINFEVKLDFYHRSIKDPNPNRTCIFTGKVKAKRDLTKIKINSYKDFPAGIRFMLGGIELNALFQCLNSLGLTFLERKTNE